MAFGPQLPGNHYRRLRSHHISRWRDLFPAQPQTGGRENHQRHHPTTEQTEYLGVRAGKHRVSSQQLEDPKNRQETIRVKVH